MLCWNPGEMRGRDFHLFTRGFRLLSEFAAQQVHSSAYRLLKQHGDKIHWEVAMHAVITHSKNQSPSFQTLLSLILCPYSQGEVQVLPYFLSMFQWWPLHHRAVPLQRLSGLSRWQRWTWLRWVSRRNCLLHTEPCQASNLARTSTRIIWPNVASFSPPHRTLSSFQHERMTYFCSLTLMTY